MEKSIACTSLIIHEKKNKTKSHLKLKYQPVFSGVGNTGYGYGYGYQGVDQGYVTRKELVKSGLLLGAGILKGALLTTVINNINNNNNGK